MVILPLRDQGRENPHNDWGIKVADHQDYLPAGHHIPVLLKDFP